MSAIPKRRWFRFHLLTAVLMMLAAGGLIWLNIQKYERASYFYRHFASMIGWPLGFREHPIGDNVYITWSYSHLAADLAVAVMILCCVSVASESILRRREARET